MADSHLNCQLHSHIVLVVDLVATTLGAQGGHQYNPMEELLHRHQVRCRLDCLRSLMQTGTQFENESVIGSLRLCTIGKHMDLMPMLNWLSLRGDCETSGIANRWIRLTPIVRTSFCNEEQWNDVMWKICQKGNNKK